MKIYADPTKGWFHGLGDVVCFAWLGEGIIQAGHDVEFFASDWHAEVLRLFGMPITDNEEGAIFTDDGYEKAVAADSPLNYLEWIADKLGITEKPARPRLNLDPMNREFGRKAAVDVLIFPHGAWAPRTWPPNYFVELGFMLRDAGYSVRFVTKERDYKFFMPFKCLVGKPWAFIAGAIQMSKLVIGNDSGPAHLAGTIGTKTMTILGPTQGERIYGYLPDVVPYAKKVLSCAGCHCLPTKNGKPAFRMSCDSGCFELYRTFPEDVFEAAVTILNQQQQQKAA